MEREVLGTLHNLIPTEQSFQQGKRKRATIKTDSFDSTCDRKTVHLIGLSEYPGTVRISTGFSRSARNQSQAHKSIRINGNEIMHRLGPEMPRLQTKRDLPERSLARFGVSQSKMAVNVG